jgi:hypothetical protein
MVHPSFAGLIRSACGERDSALRASHLSRTDSPQFCRWNLVSAAFASSSEGRLHFFEIDLFPGRHSGIYFTSRRERATRLVATRPAKVFNVFGSQSQTAIGLKGEFA